MTPEFANAVDPVFEYVLELLDRIEGGHEASAEQEHQRILRILDRAEAELGAGNENWKSAKFALACWVDELLSAHVWQGADYWANNPVERVLFGTADRALLFYTWAKKAATERQRDALEVYFVCVILGFRGLYEIPEVAAGLVDKFELSATLNVWLSQTGSALQLRRGVPPIIPSGKIPPGAPELRGHALLMAALLAVIAAGALAGLAWALHQPG
ncbi:MAG: DotU family type IV/VI secretion system protein [Planctomycetota bacterium]|nr:DotU family type IV/VI secretion system protein [Planctomycetota bacterium]